MIGCVFWVKLSDTYLQCGNIWIGYSLQRVGKKSVNAKINRKKIEFFLKTFIFRFSNEKVYGLIIFRHKKL